MTGRAVPIVYATHSGGTTMDQDARGGNPFATALIQLAAKKPRSRRPFPERLRAATIEASGHHQVPEWRDWPEASPSFDPLWLGASAGTRCALLLMVSAYSGGGLAPLAGAARDEHRLAAMLQAKGFTVVHVADTSRDGLVKALADFARLSRRHDAALIYSTGHGVERRGRVHLLPRDYAVAQGCSAAQLRAGAIPIERFAAACRAKTANVVFFAGCRTLVV